MLGITSTLGLYDTSRLVWTGSWWMVGWGPVATWSAAPRLLQRHPKLYETSRLVCFGWWWRSGPGTCPVANRHAARLCLPQQNCTRRLVQFELEARTRHATAPFPAFPVRHTIPEGCPARLPSLYSALSVEWSRAATTRAGRI